MYCCVKRGGEERVGEDVCLSVVGLDLMGMNHGTNA